jgi:hypothetical protein
VDDPNLKALFDKQDKRLANSFFGITASLSFCNAVFKVYGAVDKDGLTLMTYEQPPPTEAFGTKLTNTDQFKLKIDSSSLSTALTMDIKLQLDIPAFSALGVDIGAINCGIDVGATVSLTVTYGERNWMNDSIKFFASVSLPIILSAL